MFQGKRLLDLTVKMWTEDLSNGLIGYDELKEDFNCEFFNRVVRSIMKKIIEKKSFNPREGLGIIAGSNRILYVRETMGR